MKGFSVMQPWAGLLARGEKRIETRSWCTGWRGLVAIHASKRFPRRLREMCDYGGVFYQDLAPYFARDLYHVETGEPFGRGVPATISDLLPLGAIVAVGYLAEIITTERALAACPVPVIGARLSEKELRMGDYGPGRFAWVFREMVRLPEPIPCRGALGLWHLGKELEAWVREQIEMMAA